LLFSTPLKTYHVSSRLQAAFWRKYPQLHQISQSLIEHVSNSARLRLKDKVAELVIRAWGIVESLKGSDLQVSITDFDRSLETSVQQLLSSGIQGAEIFLDKFLMEQLQHTLPTLLSLYPHTQGVIDTANKLTLMHCAPIKSKQIEVYSAYAAKKLAEVKISSIQQRTKALAANQSNESIPLVGALTKQSTDATSRNQEIVLIGVIGNLQACENAVTALLYSFIQRQECKIDRHAQTRVHLLWPGSGEIILDRENIFRMFLTYECQLNFDAVVMSCDSCLNIRLLCGEICTFLYQMCLAVGRYSLAIELETSEQRNLNRKSAVVMIVNCIEMINSFQNWWMNTRGSSINNEEIIGRVKIEFTKMYTSIGSTLFHFDIWVECNHHDTLRYDTTSPPSTVLLQFCHTYFISPESLSNILTAVMKPCVYSVWYCHSSARYQQRRAFYGSVLKFIGSYLNGMFHDKGLQLDFQSVSTWHLNSENVFIVKKSISKELGDVVEVLINFESRALLS
jgi:hypothetical protein